VSQWAAKRFWSTTSVVPEAGGYGIRLDARVVKTPAKQPLIVPTEAMATAIADEWQAQTGKVNPESMPVTRSANSAIDKVGPQFDAVVHLTAAYGASDLLCYRAAGPVELVVQQAQVWDPLLAWAKATYGVDLQVTIGVMPITQPAAATTRLHAEVARLSPFQLTAFHDIVALTGSLVLALAVTQGQLTTDQAWQLSRIDEDWQISLWGADEDAAALAAFRHAALQHAGRFYALCGSQS
jgi:chaperone required for assembly of F1-ATPase